MEKIEIDFSMQTGKVDRKFSDEWSHSGIINMDKVPQLVSTLVEQRRSMVAYIEALHDKLDDIILKNRICHHPYCHTAGCSSDHK